MITFLYKIIGMALQLLPKIKQVNLLSFRSKFFLPISNHYVINDIVKKPSTTPGTIGDPQSAKSGSKQTPALNKESNSRNTVHSSIDSIASSGEVGDTVTPQLRQELLAFARGETGS